MNRFELIRVRKELGYNQMLLAEILGVSKQYLSMMENGRKPLNEKALLLIHDINNRKGGYLTIGGRENGKKVDKQPLKTKKIRGRFSVKTKVAQLYDIPQRRSAWERWWFKKKHPMCKECSRECKQSAFVGLYCPQFTEVKT